MQSGKYFGALFLLFLFLFIDIFLNCFIFTLRVENVVVLVLYIFQDICLVFALIVMSLMFVNTYIFQAGLVRILVRKFKFTIITNVLYLIVTVAFHCVDLSQRWKYPDYYYWDSYELSVLFTIQRMLAGFHYYFYKRTALRLADPLFYKDSQWLRNWLKGIKSGEHQTNLMLASKTANDISKKTRNL
ncbi:transmembrane protein 138-like [Symsagittifera roscoffensis]|uniref:transmembrane protein 138-like n=1 Tax=Symsagittifera roscoffensis TaxID=84072 RepID=UPI00307B6E02